MLILLTQADKQELFFDAAHIRAVSDSPKNPMLCTVITDLLTQQGFQSFECIGSKESLAQQINRARAGKNDLEQ